MAVFVVVEICGLVVSSGVPEDVVVDGGGIAFGAIRGVEFYFAECGISIML